jgi:hypothetical protein
MKVDHLNIIGIVVHLHINLDNLNQLLLLLQLLLQVVQLVIHIMDIYMKHIGMKHRMLINGEENK